MSVASSRSLLRTEAVARREQLDVTSYDVTLDLAGGSEDGASVESTFASTTRIVFESTGGATFVDLKPIAVAAIWLNGRPLDPDLLESGRLPLETSVGTNELLVEASMPLRNDGERLHLHVDPADGRRYVYGMSFMDAAPTIFACFDQPGRWEIGPTAPLSTYSSTLVAGPYYVERYFAELPATAQVGTGWVLAIAAAASCPRTAVDDETLEQTSALLASGDLEPAVQRRVADQADTLARRLAVRAAYPLLEAVAS